jgi:hypothetical protein
LCAALDVGDATGEHGRSMTGALPLDPDFARGMGGDLSADSTLGVGSTFVLTLPAA